MNKTENVRPKILLVEDDMNLGYVIKDNLEHKNFDVCLYSNGEEGFEAFNSDKFDVCLLDVMLPKQDGFTLATKIRNADKDIALIFLTAKSMKEDKINGFTIGADDYITKPFNIDELVLRIKVFLKRSGKDNPGLSGIMKLGSYVFDYTNLELVAENKIIRKLTQKEADLLKLLCDYKEQMIRREDILKKVWETDDYFAGRSMDVFISRLRKLLSADKNIEIVNYHGVGFKLIAG